MDRRPPPRLDHRRRGGHHDEPVRRGPPPSAHAGQPGRGDQRPLRRPHGPRRALRGHVVRPAQANTVQLREARGMERHEGLDDQRHLGVRQGAPGRAHEARHGGHVRQDLDGRRGVRAPVDPRCRHRAHVHVVELALLLPEPSHRRGHVEGWADPHRRRRRRALLVQPRHDVRRARHADEGAGRLQRPQPGRRRLERHVPAGYRYREHPIRRLRARHRKPARHLRAQIGQRRHHRRGRAREGAPREAARRRQRGHRERRHRRDRREGPLRAHDDGGHVHRDRQEGRVRPPQRQPEGRHRSGREARSRARDRHRLDRLRRRRRRRRGGQLPRDRESRPARQRQGRRRRRVRSRRRQRRRHGRGRRLPLRLRHRRHVQRRSGRRHRTRQRDGHERR